MGNLHQFSIEGRLNVRISLCLLIALPVILAIVIVIFQSLAAKKMYEDVASSVQKENIPVKDFGRALGIDDTSPNDNLNQNLSVKEKSAQMLAKRVKQLRDKGIAVCEELIQALGNKLPKLAAKIKCKVGYFFRLMWSCISMVVTVIALLALYHLFPKNAPIWLHDFMRSLRETLEVRRPVSIKVCTSANEKNVQQLIMEISSRFPIRVKDVQYVLLPYNDLDLFSFKNIDVMILCHSIHNRRFVITDVMDALYNKFLSNAETALGKKKVCVIAHDFPREEKSEQRYEDEMTAFRHRQPSTFNHSNLAMMAGRLDKTPAELSEDQWKELDDFINEAEVAGRPLDFYDIRVPILLIASLMVVLFFVPALMKNIYMVMLFVMTFVAAVTLFWPRLHLKWYISIWVVENVLNCIFQLSPSSWMVAMLLSGLAVAIVTFLALFDTFYMQEQNFKRTMRRVLNYIKRRGKEDPAYETKKPGDRNLLT